MSEYYECKRVIYNGVCFHSKLEARWAVVFDTLGIKWIYEPETFKREWGNEVFYYRPDFYLPEHRMYVEVKPSDEKLNEIKNKIGAMVDWEGPLANGLIILGSIPSSTKITDRLPAFSFLYNNKAVCLGRVVFRCDDIQVIDEDIDFCELEDGFPDETSVFPAWYPCDDSVSLRIARQAFDAGWFPKNFREDNP